MEEIYQITSALKHLSFGKQVAVAHRRPVLRRLDRRLHRPRRPRGPGRRPDRQGPRRRPRSGSSSTASGSKGSVDLVGAEGVEFGAEEGARILAERPPHPDLSPDPDLPDDTRLWAALQAVGGGTWGGCVYDTDAIIAALALARERRAVGEVVAP